jgi:hypothetical protein
LVFRKGFKVNPKSTHIQESNPTPSDQVKISKFLALQEICPASQNRIETRLPSPKMKQKSKQTKMTLPS